jgi:hypothetical protein
MTAHPIFYQFVPFHSYCNFEDRNEIDTSDNKLIWQLRLRLGCAYYVCMHGLQCGAREEDCSTPLFITKDIPDYVLDYMNHYAKVMQVGAAWYRQNYRK